MAQHGFFAKNPLDSTGSPCFFSDRACLGGGRFGWRGGLLLVATINDAILAVPIWSSALFSQLGRAIKTVDILANIFKSRKSDSSGFFASIRTLSKTYHLTKSSIANICSQ